MTELFLKCSELPAGDRDEVLDRECGGDVELRALVESMLAFDDAEGRFLSGTASQTHLLAPDETPSRIGSFAILGELGRGGMGTVYEAVQERPRRTVALKVLRPGLLSRSALLRFRREEDVLGRLRHPGIAQIYDSGTAETPAGPQPFFAMELVRGEPITAFAQRGSLGVRDRVRLLTKVCDAVHHAHRNAVIHRDLKPDNILVEASGRPKVLDFGVARASDSDLQQTTLHTQAGQIMGTLAYMSPEQAGGDPREIDARTDVYSLGVLLYELLCERLPYGVAGKPLHKAVQTIQEVEPARFPANLPRDLVTITLHALEKDRERRYGSADALAQDLRRYLNDEPVLVRPASTFYQLRKFARRHRGLVGGVVTAFVALGVALVVSLWQTGVAVEARDVADRERRVSDQQAYRASMATASMAIEAGDPLTARRTLDEIPRDRRAWEWRHFRSRADRSMASVPCGEPPLDASLGPDGEDLVAVFRDGTLRTWIAETGELRSTRDLRTGPLRSAALSRDAEHLAASPATGDRISLWRLDGPDASPVGSWPVPFSVKRVDVSDRGEVVVASGADMWVHRGGESRVFPRDIDRRGRPTFRTKQSALSGDGSLLAYTGQFFDVHVHRAFDTSTGKRSVRFPNAKGVVSTSLSFDGSSAAFALMDRKIELHSSVPGEPVVLHGHGLPPTTLDLRPDGRALASAGPDRTIRLWDIGAESPSRVLYGDDGEIEQVRFSVDGSRLLSRSNGTIRTWDPAHEDSGAVEAIGPFVYALDFAPDGATVVSGSWHCGLEAWDVASRQRIAAARWSAADRLERGGVASLCHSPDGRWIATGHLITGHVLLWDAVTLEPVRTLSTSKAKGNIEALAFSPDSRLLVGARAEGGVFAWDPLSGALRYELRGGAQPLRAVAFDPAGTVLATTGEGGVTLSDPYSGTATGKLATPKCDVHDVAFHPGGTRLAAALSDGSIQVWDWKRRTLLARWTGHTEGTFALDYSPDGSRLASGGRDGTVRLWSTETGEPMVILNGHEDYVRGLRFAPDGSRLVSASGDGTLRFWDTSPESRVFAAARASERAGERVRPTVQEAFRRLGLRTAVIRAIQDDPDLSPVEKRAARRIAFEGWPAPPLTGRAPEPTAGLRVQADELIPLEGPDVSSDPALTFELWVRPEAHHASGMLLQGGALFLSLEEGGELAWSSRPHLKNLSSTGYRLPEESWTHVTVTMTPELVEVYLNGVSVQRRPGGALARVPARSKAIGGGTEYEGFAGRVADLRIWSHARSASQIRASIDGTPPEREGLLLHWAARESVAVPIEASAPAASKR